jgi:hypothetical protein
MRDVLEELFSVASGALFHEPSDLSQECVRLAGPLGEELRSVLERKNGFYAFESSLHLFPAGNCGIEMDLDQWNSLELWRTAYGELAEGCLFFAEDIFGGQFCIYRGGICTFDPETGIKERVAASFEEWAGLILDDYPAITGHSLAHEWQARHGRLPSGKRLIPKQPFVLEGAYTLTNLYSVDAVRGMRLRGELALQLRDIPDGGRVQFDVVD